MKYLKKFNEELKHSTYQSAATKLKKIGHVKRADAIKKHSINSNWKKLKDEFQEWGSSKLYFNKRLVGSYLQADGDDHSGDFYIALDFMDDPTAESIIDGKEGDKLYLYFYMNMIPVDNDTIKICNSNLTEPDFNGSYQGPFPSIKYNVVDGELKFDGIHLDSAENNWKLSRRAAMIFKKQLLSFFEQGGNYDSVYERIRETLNREDFSLEFNYDMENIYNDIKNYPINYLYKE